MAGTASAAELPVQPTFRMLGVKKATQGLSIWFPTGNGGFESADGPLEDAGSIADVIYVDTDRDALGDGAWTVHKNGVLEFCGGRTWGTTVVGTGWNAYDRLLSVGDLNLDGKADLLARKPGGQLMRYYGTGVASPLFKSPTQIGTGYQAFSLL